MCRINEHCYVMLMEKAGFNAKNSHQGSISALNQDRNKDRQAWVEMLSGKVLVSQLCPWALASSLSSHPTSLFLAGSSAVEFPDQPKWTHWGHSGTLLVYVSAKWEHEEGTWKSQMAPAVRTASTLLFSIRCYCSEEPRIWLTHQTKG